MDDRDHRLLQRLFADARITVEGAKPEAIASFEERLGFEFPSLFERILLRSNGGDFCFGQLAATPFVPDAPAASPEREWERYLGQLFLPEADQHHPVLSARRAFPFAHDYGTGYSCFDLAETDPDKMPVLFIPDHAHDEGYADFVPELEAESFAEFVEMCIARGGM